MNIDRRQFLKLAGLSSLAGFGSLSLTELFDKNALEAVTAAPHEKGLKAKRLAMVVDMSRFTSDDDYQRCVTACHQVHNVPEIDNPKHEVKWIWTESFEHAFPGQQNAYIPARLKNRPFLLLCNHCDNPPCVRVCPTKATFKRKDGIVTMDMHRCIGCRFCMAACPFGARSFNWIDPRPLLKEEYREYPTRTKGVVEKCNFCAERLAKGLKPACVEVSHGALIFGDLDDPHSEVREILSTHYTIRRKPELGTQPSVFYVIK